MKEVLMNLDSDDVIDRVVEKSKLLRTVLSPPKKGLASPLVQGLVASL